MDRRKSPNRAGFTLVEVLVAVLIIATLVAILLPAVRGAYRTAQEAQVTSELNNIATALASFKNTYGDFPPSRVVLCEAGYNNSGLTAAQLAAPAGTLAGTFSPSGNDTDITVGQLIQRSRLYLRRFWPRVDFDTTRRARRRAVSTSTATGPRTRPTPQRLRMPDVLPRRPAGQQRERDLWSERLQQVAHQSVHPPELEQRHLDQPHGAELRVQRRPARRPGWRPHPLVHRPARHHGGQPSLLRLFLLVRDGFLRPERRQRQW